MMCPECGGGNVYVVDSREKETYKRRRYKCTDCGHRWNTAEIPLEELELLEKKRQIPLAELRQAAKCLNRLIKLEVESIDRP